MGTGPFLGSTGQLALAATPEAWAAGMTARTLGADHAVPIESEEITHEEQKVDDGALVGQTHQRKPIPTGYWPKGPVKFQGDYNYLPLSLALAMGIAGVPAEVEASFRYSHRLQLHDNLLGVYGTIGADRRIDKTGSDGDETAYQYAAAKANGFTFSASQAETANLVVPFLCREITEDGDPAAWTYRKNVNTEMQYLLLSQAVLRINAASGSALGSGDVLPRPTSVELSYAPDLNSDVIDDEGPLDEPVMRTPPKSRLVVTWTRVTQALRTLLAEAAKTELKADLVFTGAVLGAGNFSMTISMPALTVDSDINHVLANSGLTGYPVEFHLQEAISAPSGMTGITKPFDVTIVNNISTDPLATS